MIGADAIGEQPACGRWVWSWGVPVSCLLALWLGVILFVNPGGEFMVNDDWCFVQVLESWRQGQPHDTGWGGGGPSALVHILWGGLFASLLGDSLTVLRESVLMLGLLTTLGFFALMRRQGAAPELAFFATLVLMLNPLFLSQSFTFMTDVTFAAALCASLLGLQLAMETGRRLWMHLGFAASLAAVLTRQFGVILPLGFVLTAIWMRPHGWPWQRALRWGALWVFVPWLVYEAILKWTGSSPLTHHASVRALFLTVGQGLPALAGRCMRNVLPSGLLYLGVFASPLLCLHLAALWQSRAFRVWTRIHWVAVALAASGAAVGWWRIPVWFQGNVISDSGIGPVLLKDVYIMGIRRFPGLPDWAYAILVGWAVFSSVALIRVLAAWALSQWRGSREERAPACFTAALALAAVLLYGGITAPIEFHDRYLIPSVLLLLVALMPATASVRSTFAGRVAALVVMGLLGVFSVAGTRDFMEMKRAVAAAHEHMEDRMGLGPESVDGGFEYNGYHRSRAGFTPGPGLSWWWVEREEAVIALGGLPGFRTAAVFPFHRCLGPGGRVHILVP